MQIRFTLSGFHPGFPSRGGKCSNCQIKGRGGEDHIVFLGFVGEGILWYNSNYYSNKGVWGSGGLGSGGAPPGKF